MGRRQNSAGHGPLGRAVAEESEIASEPPRSAFQRLTDDGRRATDNSRAENQFRVVAADRKNWLFAGSFEGARRTRSSLEAVS